MSKKSYGQIVISENDEILKSFKKTDANHEFEMSFLDRRTNLLNMESFLRVLEYLKLRSRLKKQRIIDHTTLDVVVNLDAGYRLSISGLDNIQKYILNVHKKRNHVIFKILLGKMLLGDKNITLLKKTRDDVIDIEEYSIRVKLSREEDATNKDIELLKKIDETNINDVIIRYKQRVSLFVEESKSGVLRIDLTSIKQTNNLDRIESIFPKYELEIDYTGNNDTSILDKMFHEVEILHKVINESNFVVSKSESEQVLSFYNNLFSLASKKTNLDGRKPVSLELIHLLDTLPNKYAIVDKADGDRYFLIVMDKYVYLISNNLRVKNTGIVLSDNTHSGSVLDGEYVFLPKHNRHIFLAFDCLFSSGDDIRNESSYMKRLEYADTLVEKCFVPKGEKYFKMKNFSGDFNTDKIAKFYKGEIVSYMSYLNKLINTDKKVPVVLRKIIIPALGGSDNEIYKYADLIWKSYVYDKEVGCPYILDGVIFAPLDQKYITSVKETKFFDYKMKPPQKNSIDMYVMFERDHDTGKVITVFDNSREEYVKGKPYRIAHLYVGRQTKTGEKPVLFQQETRKYIAYLFLKDGEVRDETGAIIKDKTVVEFNYNTESGLEDTHRWNPMRTRYDKTEIVHRFKKGYGNYYEIANKVWRSIINPITFTDIEILADNAKYMQHKDFLKTRIDHSLILSEKKENIFNQIRRNLARPMRNFHNWIRSILIYTYCNQIYEKGTKLSILDIGCGKGELDMMKYYYTMADFYVGIDINYDALMSAADGAVSRYNQLRKSHPNFPRYNFIHADVTVPLSYENQKRVLGNMSVINKTLLEKFFSDDLKQRTMFDRVSCQDTIQFLLRDSVSWNGFTENLNNYLKPGGFFLFTCLDGDRVRETLGDKDEYTVYYNSDKGEKRILFEILKKYDSDKIKKGEHLGNAIDFHSFSEQEGVYVTQYLVDKQFIVEELDKRSDLELVMTDLFSNQFRIHADYFRYIYTYEENPKTRGFFEKVAEFYDQAGSVNQACFKLTQLHRMYVFRKREKEIKVQKGGMEILEQLEKDRYITRLDKDQTDSYSFVNSVAKSLKSVNLIPQTGSAIELFGDDYQPDVSLNPDKIKSILKKIKITHILGKKQKTVLDGVSVIIAEKDCNGDLEYTTYGSAKQRKAVYLYLSDGVYTPVYNQDHHSYMSKIDILD